MTLYKDVAVEYKDGEQEDGGYIVAYASTFDREPDAYGDVVAPGAFTKSLAKHEAEDNPIQFLFGHRTDDPLYNIGTVISAEEDDRGLLIEAKFDPSNEKAQYARKLVKEGRLKKLSFAYDVIEQAPVVLADGTKANELRELDIFEVSLVPIPANQHAEVVFAKDGEAAADRDRDPLDDSKQEEPESEKSDEKIAATAFVEIIPRLGDATEATLKEFKEAIKELINEAITEALDEGAVLASEEDPIEQKKGDPSPAEASVDGGKGASDVDEDFLAKYRKYTEKEEK